MGSAFLFAKDYLPDVEEPTPVTPFGRLRWPGDAAPAPAPAAPTATAIDPEDVFGLPGGKQLPGEASPLNALPAPPTLSRSGDTTRIDLGPTSTFSIPGGTISVDRSRGLGGEAWAESARSNPGHSWNAATRGWVAPGDDRIIKTNQEPSSFDELVADRGPVAPVSSLSRERGDGPMAPGSERTLFSGRGTLGQLLGDIQAQGLLGARDQASGGRALADLGRRAQASTFEELIRDPFAKERVQGEMDVRSRLAPILAAGRNQRLSEQERRDAYRQGRETIFQDFVKKRAELQQKGDRDGLARLEEAHDEAVQAMREAFGIGARMNSGSLYETAG